MDFANTEMVPPPILPYKLLDIVTMEVKPCKSDDLEGRGYVCVSSVWDNPEVYEAGEFGIKGGVNWGVFLSDPRKVSRVVNAMKYYKKRYCWWDVICISQDDQYEKHREIPRMPNYFAGSDITFVISSKKYTMSENLKRWCNMVKNITELERLPTKDELAWVIGLYDQDLLDISGDIWFERAWVVQEAVLSKRVILVSVDGSYISLTDILANIPYLYSKNLGCLLIPFSSCDILLELAESMSNFRNNTHNLASALAQCASRKTTTEHDKFFSAISLLNYGGFYVDYTTEIKDVNMEFIQCARSNGDFSYDGRWAWKL
jgi:hypothetical protein